MFNKGDVVELKKGDRVWTMVPYKFAKDDAYMQIKIGEILNRQKPNERSLRSALQKTLWLETGEMFSEEKLGELVELLNLDFSEETYDTAHYAGAYSVVSVYADWQTAMAASDKGFPYKVVLQHMENPDVKVELIEYAPYESAG